MGSLLQEGLGGNRRRGGDDVVCHRELSGLNVHLIMGLLYELLSSMNFVTTDSETLSYLISDSALNSDPL